MSSAPASKPFWSRMFRISLYLSVEAVADAADAVTFAGVQAVDDDVVEGLVGAAG